MESQDSLRIPPELKLVPRRLWGALPPKSVDPRPHSAYVILFNYYSPCEWCYNRKECSQTVRQLQKEHLAKGLPDISYNFMVGADAKIYEGRGWDANPEMLPEYEQYKGYLIEICTLGDLRVCPPSDAMFDAVYNLIHFGRLQGRVRQGYHIIDHFDHNYDLHKNRTKLPFKMRDWPDIFKVRKKYRK